jgi:type VI protein secretion system component VasA
MRTHVDGGLKEYFQLELSQLEVECHEFFLQYPQLAGHIGPRLAGASDPRLRQLIEADAFIAARLKQQMDALPPARR